MRPLPAVPSQCPRYPRRLLRGQNCSRLRAVGATAAVASADQGVDENVDTRPTEHVAVRPTLPAQQAEIEFRNLFLGLSLQDYYFQCFSRERDQPGKPHLSVFRHLNELESEANVIG